MPPLDFPLKALARLFAAQSSTYLRYRQDRWLALDPIDDIWRRDLAGVRVQAARELVDKAAEVAGNPNMGSTANIDALLRCAAFEPAITQKIANDRLDPDVLGLASLLGRWR